MVQHVLVNNAALANEHPVICSTSPTLAQMLQAVYACPPFNAAWKSLPQEKCMLHLRPFSLGITAELKRSCHSNRRAEGRHDWMHCNRLSYQPKHCLSRTTLDHGLGSCLFFETCRLHHTATCTLDDAST